MNQWVRGPGYDADGSDVKVGLHSGVGNACAWTGNWLSMRVMRVEVGP